MSISAEEDEERYLKTMREFLQKKGMTDVLAVLDKKKPLKTSRKSTTTSVPILNPDVILTSDSDLTTTKLQRYYQSFSEWVNNLPCITSSAERNKNQLLSVLFSVFSHIYLLLLQDSKNNTSLQMAQKFLKTFKDQFLPAFEDDLRRLSSVTSLEDIENNEYTKKLLESRRVITLHQETFETLMKRLEDTAAYPLQSLIIKHCDLKVEQSVIGKYQAIEDMESLNLHRPLVWEVKSLPFQSKRSKTKKLPSLPTTKSITEQQQQDELLQFKTNLPLTPSICYYTVIHDSMNCVKVTTAASNRLPMIAAGFEDSSIKLWNIRETPDSLYGHCGPVYSVAFSNDNQWLLSGSEDTTARLWNLETRSTIVCYKGHQYPIWDVDFSEADYLFATASHDKTTRLWATDRVTPLRLFAGHLSDVDCVRFHPNGLLLASGSSDKSIRLWDIHQAEVVRIFDGRHQSSVQCLAFSNDGRYLASGGCDNEIFVWDLPSGKVVHHLLGHNDHVLSVCFNDDGSLLASGSLDGSVRVWNFKESQAYYTKNSPVFFVDFQRSNLLLAAGPFSGF